MKNSIKAISILLLTLVIGTSTGFTSIAATADDISVAAQINKITKLEVSGNIDVILVQSSTERILDYDHAKASVQQDGATLKLTSLKSEKVSIVVYVNNLFSIKASDIAKVSTFGRFNLLDLLVQLTDYASADINASVINLRTSVNDHSQLKLAGDAVQYSGSLSALAKVSLDQFKSESTTVTGIVPTYVVAKKFAAFTLPEIDL